MVPRTRFKEPFFIGALACAKAHVTAGKALV